MNFNRFIMLSACVAMLAMFMSCNEKHKSAGGGKATSPTTASAPAQNMVIRYVDEDSIMANYNLAKDINEAMLRKQNQFDAAQQQRSNDLNKFAEQMQNKYQNNGYLNEESFKADQSTLEKKQREAESYLSNLQQNMQNELGQSQQQLLDSIDNFMRDYAREKGYDMVIRKSATLYIDPSYDVTDEVIKGLNKRYVKVGHK